jgi:hypothetical protein
VNFDDFPVDVEEKRGFGGEAVREGERGIQPTDLDDFANELEEHFAQPASVSSGSTSVATDVLLCGDANRAKATI